MVLVAEMQSFLRKEKKFRLTPEQYAAVFPVLEEHMKPGKFRNSTVLSLYFDTDSYTLIRRSIERPVWKEKLRLRSYGLAQADTEVFCEIKRKCDGIGYKRRIKAPYADILRLLEGESIGSDTPEAEEEVRQFLKRWQVKPKVFLAYEREAWTAAEEDSDLRVTIDSHIVWRTERLGLSSGFDGTPLLDRPEDRILEVKTTFGMPEWLRQVLGKNGIYQAPFSKVGTCYTKYIAPYAK